VRIARDLRGEGLLPDPALTTRGDRDRVVAALQLVLESRVDKGLLARALEDAVLLDEYRSLPEPQRVVVEAVIERHRPIPDVAAAFGLRPAEVRDRLNEALRRVAAGAEPLLQYMKAPILALGASKGAIMYFTERRRRPPNRHSRPPVSP
jgi:DNA-directed RNA polymerase specialized sigma24 family protein